MSLKSIRENQYAVSRSPENMNMRPDLDPMPSSEDEREFNSTIKQVKNLARILLVEIESLTLAQCRDIDSGFDFYEMVKHFEVNLIERALLKTGGHQRRAARLLGLRAGTLSAKMKLYDIKLKPELVTQVEDGRIADHNEYHELIS